LSETCENKRLDFSDKKEGFNKQLDSLKSTTALG